MTDNLTEEGRKLGVLTRQFKAFVKSNPKLIDQDIDVLANAFLSNPSSKNTNPIDKEIEQLEQRKKFRHLNAMRENERLQIELENKRMRDELAGKEVSLPNLPEKDKMEDIKTTLNFLKDVKSLLPSEGGLEEPPFDATEYALQEGIPILRDYLTAKMINGSPNIINETDMSKDTQPNIEVKNDIETVSRGIEVLPSTTSGNISPDTPRNQRDKGDNQYQQT